MGRVLLFDLDETLMIEEPAAAAAFMATAQLATRHYDGVESDFLVSAARSRARELWYAAPTHDYCLRVGISSWEGLWCRFEGEDHNVRALREWAPTYRHETWRLALADQGVNDSQLAGELAERFGEERRARHEVYPDVADTLAELAASYRLAVVTNGAGCLQREKLAASGLGDFFQAVIVSADLGVAKPAAEVFQYAMRQFEARSEVAVMIGDSLEKDVNGALAVGFEAVWLNRNGGSAPEERTSLIEISTLSDLPAVLSSLKERASA